MCSHCICGRVPWDNGGSLNIHILLWLHKAVVAALFSLCSRSFAAEIMMSGQ